MEIHIWTLLIMSLNLNQSKVPHPHDYNHWIIGNSSLPRSTTDNMAVAYDNLTDSIWLVGGYDGPTGALGWNQLVQFQRPTNMFVDYGASYFQNTYSKSIQMSSSSCQLNEYLYLQDYHGSTVHRFNARTQQMNFGYYRQPNYLHSSCLCLLDIDGGYLVINGGEQQAISKSWVFILNIATNKWLSNRASLNGPRWAHTCNTFNDTAFAIAGYSEHFNSILTVEVFNFYDNQWTELPDTLLSTGSARLRSVQYQNEIVIFGGSRGSINVINAITHEIYSIRSNVDIFILDPAPINVLGIIYLFGGTTNGGQRLSSWRYVSPKSSFSPTEYPTYSPSESPSEYPTYSPSQSPSEYQTPTNAPSESPPAFTSYFIRSGVKDHQVAGLYIAFCFFCGYLLLCGGWLNDKCGCWRRKISGFAPFTMLCDPMDVLDGDEIIIKHWNNYSLKQDNKNETMIKAHGVQWKSCRFTINILDINNNVIHVKHSSDRYLSLTNYGVHLVDTNNDNVNTNNPSWQLIAVRRAVSSSNESIKIKLHHISNGVYRFESVTNSGYYLAVLPPTQKNYFIGTPQMIHINDANYNRYTLFYLFKKQNNDENNKNKMSECKSIIQSIKCLSFVKCLLTLTPTIDIVTDIWTVVVYNGAKNNVAAAICIMILYYSFRIYWFFHFSITKIGIKMKDANFGIIDIMSCSLIPWFSLLSLKPFFCWRRSIDDFERIRMFLQKPFLWKGQIRNQLSFILFFLMLELLLDFALIIFQTPYLILKNCLTEFKTKWTLIRRERSDLKKKQEQQLATNEFLKGCECLFEAIPQFIFQTVVFYTLCTDKNTDIGIYRVIQYCISALISLIAFIRTVYAIKTDDLWSKSLLDIMDIAQTGSLIDYKYIREVQGVDDFGGGDGEDGGDEGNANIGFDVADDADAEFGDPGDVDAANCDAGDFDAGDFGS